MILPIGEQDQHLVVVAFFEGGEGRLNRFSYGRAALGNDIHIERLDALAEGRVVDGQRALEERAARERYQPQPVGPRALHQFERGQLRPRQTVGGNVLRQHALRSVDGDDDVQPALLHLLPVKAPLRSRQRQDEADHS